MDRRTFLAAAAGSALAAPALVRGAMADETVIRMRELYNRDLSFSDFALSRADQTVTVEGFMAPPLKVDTNFFVLTKMPMATCPFCSSASDWPNDIVAIYGREVLSHMPFNVPLRVSGQLKLGVYTDEALGFVSKVRLVDADYRRA